jgi:hypothetical protein
MWSGLTLHWKYHAPDESKLLYRGCLASFENRNFCIKLSKIQSRKNIDISVISVFFFRYRFSVFFKYRNSLAVTLHILDNSISSKLFSLEQGLNFIAAIAVEGEQNTVDYCGNYGNFLPYSVIFILFTVHYYFDTWIQTLIKSCVN